LQSSNWPHNLLLLFLFLNLSLLRIIGAWMKLWLGPNLFLSLKSISLACSSLLLPQFFAPAMNWSSFHSFHSLHSFLFIPSFSFLPFIPSFSFLPFHSFLFVPFRSFSFIPSLYSCLSCPHITLFIAATRISLHKTTSRERYSCR
jgi:hypothetical protein